MTMMAVAPKAAAAKKQEVSKGVQIEDGKENFKELFQAAFLSLVPSLDNQQASMSEPSPQEIPAGESLFISGSYRKVLAFEQPIEMLQSMDLAEAQIPVEKELSASLVTAEGLPDTEISIPKIADSPEGVQVFEKKERMPETIRHFQGEKSLEMEMKDLGTKQVKMENKPVFSGDTLLKPQEGVDTDRSVGPEREQIQILMQESAGSWKSQTGSPAGLAERNDLPAMKPGDVQTFSDMVVQEVHTMSEGDVDTIRVRLTPEKFGEMEVVLKMDQGKISGKIYVDNPEAKTVIVDKLSEMNKSLSFVNATIFGVDVGFGSGKEAKQGGYLHKPSENIPVFADERSEEALLTGKLGTKVPVRGIDMLA